jgi:hypothetical protein
VLNARTCNTPKDQTGQESLQDKTGRGASKDRVLRLGHEGIGGLDVDAGSNRLCCVCVYVCVCVCG